MKTKVLPIAGMMLLSTIITGSLAAQADSAWGVGDKAPELKIEKWLKGGGTTGLQKGKVYLIDLWATWCVPCIAGMPHLSQLQQQYKDRGLEVIGITSNDAYGNTFEKASKFVETRSGILQYDIAWVPASSKNELTGIFVHPWMQKVGTMNLPTVFLVDRKGDIAFIGDPHTVDETLKEVIDDKHDVSKLRANFLAGLAAEKTFNLFKAALKETDFAKAEVLGKKILNEYSYVKANTLLGLGSSIGTIAKTNNISNELLDIGYSAAIKGVMVTRFESPGFLSTLASMYAAKKDYMQAVITQSMAVSLSEGGMRDKQKEELEQYKVMLNK